jgi:hypothetical protein
VNVKRISLLLTIAGMAMLFIAAALSAQESGIKQVIEMKNTKAFPQHKQGIVMFSHGKHNAAKPNGYGIGCGECHHDKDNKPLTNLKAGDKVQECFVCHKKPDKPKKEPGVSEKDWKKIQIEYYYGAIHENCMGCHKTQKKGPVKCAECHPKVEGKGK